MPRRRTLCANMEIRRDVCAFCNRSEENPLFGGTLTKNGIVFHRNCLYSASGLSQSVDSDDSMFNDTYVEGFCVADIMKEVNRGRRLRCSICRLPGACAGCNITSCQLRYHLPCLFEDQGITIFEGIFPSYCKRHAPQQDLTSWFRSTTEAPSCCVCLFSIVPELPGSPEVKVLVTTERQMDLQPVEVTPCVNKRILPRRSCMNTSSRKTLVTLNENSAISVPRNHRQSWEVSISPTKVVVRKAVPSPAPITVVKYQRGLLEPSKDMYSMPSWLKRYVESVSTEKYADVYSRWKYGVVHGLCCPLSWMHRSCIASYAASAGLHHLKCPYCADRDGFLRSVIAAGMWVPDRDASWELEPGAFAELAATEPVGSPANRHVTLPRAPPSSSHPSSSAGPASRITQATAPRRRRRTRKRTLPAVRQSSPTNPNMQYSETFQLTWNRAVAIATRRSRVTRRPKRRRPISTSPDLSPQHAVRSRPRFRPPALRRINSSLQQTNPSERRTTLTTFLCDSITPYKHMNKSN